MSKYTIGQEVVLKSDNSVSGAVMSVEENRVENKYIVFTTMGKQFFYESQLEACNDQMKSVQIIRKTELYALLSSTLIRTPTISSLYSLNSAKIDYIPHQFRPVLKFVQSDNQRLLIADGVGVGKTIEAGLILKELEARDDIESVLVICPKPLVSERKWEAEMKRFGEDFIALDGKSFKLCRDELATEGEWPQRYKKCILPYSVFDKASIVETGPKFSNNSSLLKIAVPHFDLVIVDEAHHIRNTASYAYMAVERFCEAADSVVFLTATPVQLEQDDLFVLLQLLQQDVFIDKEVFHEMAEPNPYITRAAAIVRKKGTDWQKRASDQISYACSTRWGKQVIQRNPAVKEVMSLLDKESISGKERIQLITDIEELHTFSRIINRTRRRDIGKFTIRKPETIYVPFTETQHVLHDEILDIIREILTMKFASQNVKFLMTTVRRQTASCLFGLVPCLKDILYRNYDELDDDYDDSTEGVDDKEFEKLKFRIADLIKVAEKIPCDDPKLERLKMIVDSKIHEKKNKILIFSSFIHTLNYLQKHLSTKYRIGVVTGKTKDEDRVFIRNKFNPNITPNDSKDAIDILLMSEVGCEGLDYQFCDCMINYDLPWNPMRVEQRIGRIDRNGQTSEFVSIYNMITPDTVDADIYDRCLMRIGVFHDSIGDCEGILGPVIKQVQDIVTNFRMSDEDRKEKLQQIADNEIRIVKEQEDLEEKQSNLFGLKVPDTFNEELEKATNIWLSPSMIESLINTWLNRLAGTQDKNFFLGEHGSKKLRVSQNIKQNIFSCLKKTKMQKDTTYRVFEKWLRSEDVYYASTFDIEYSKNHPEATLITITHPLIKLAASAMETADNIMFTMKAFTNEVKPGNYPFILYRWNYLGEKRDMKIKAVSKDEHLNEILMDLLIKGEECNDICDFNEAEYIAIDQEHHRIWENNLRQYKAKVEQMIQYKEESLKANHGRIISGLQDRLSKATDDFDRSMTSAKIQKKRERFEINLNKLEESRKKVDIVSKQLAYGRLVILAENSTNRSEG